MELLLLESTDYPLLSEFVVVDSSRSGIVDEVRYGEASFGRLSRVRSTLVICKTRVVSAVHLVDSMCYVADRVVIGSGVIGGMRVSGTPTPTE